MSKLKNLKSWLSLDETAERLTKTLKEPVSVSDLLYLALQDKIALSWYTPSATVMPVAPACLLADDMEHHRALCLPDDISQVTWRRNRAYRRIGGSDWLFWATRDWVCTEDIADEASLDKAHLEGVFHIKLDEGFRLTELGSWLHSLAKGEEDQGVKLDRFLIVDTEGNVWQVLRKMGLHPVLTDPHQEPPRVRYCPEVRAPQRKELVFQLSDIEALEESLTNDPQGRSLNAEINPSERTALLNIIGALVTHMMGSTESGDKISVFPSQASLIGSLRKYYGDKHGISRANLERKFAEARRLFSEP